MVSENHIQPNIFPSEHHPSDLQKPCSTCAKSHRFAIATKQVLPEAELECTYDEVDPDRAVARRPRAKYTVLENKISESVMGRASRHLIIKQASWRHF